VEVEREPAPLLLLRGDQLIRECRALGFAHLRLREQARILARPRREVGEHGRAHCIAAREDRVALEP